MKKKLNVYFDFLCPYCFKGVLDLINFIKDYPDLVINWQPCEAHPQPEQCDQYSDLASEAFLYVKGHKGDQITFIQEVYKAHYIFKQRIDEKELLISIGQKAGIDPARMRASLTRRDYKQDVKANNNDIWNIYAADAVPAYYCRNKRLVSRENQLIAKEDLRNFIANL